jgi:hypothetical protein
LFKICRNIKARGTLLHSGYQISQIYLLEKDYQQPETANNQPETVKINRNMSEKNTTIVPLAKVLWVAVNCNLTVTITHKSNSDAISLKTSGIGDF